ncbi:hypothetical protein ACFL6F_01845 [Planctomycetota bacterium]
MKHVCWILLICILSLSIVLFLPSCGDSSDDDDDKKTSYGPFYVSAGVTYNHPSTGFTFAIADVELSGTPNDDAVITVDAENIPWDTNPGSGFYGLNDNTTFTFTEGTDVVFSAETGDGKYTVGSTLAMPYQPSVATPTTGGGPYDSTATLNITWGALTATPQFIQVVIDAAYTVDANGYMAIISGASTSHQLPADILKSGTAGIFIRVLAGNRDGSLGSDAAEDSQFGVSNAGVSETISTQ